MSFDTVIAALETVAKAIKPGQSHYPTLFESDGTTPARLLPWWLVEPVLREIETTSELSDLSAFSVYQGRNRYCQMTPHSIAELLIYRIFAGVPAPNIVQDICNFAADTDGELCTCVALHGGGIESHIQIADDVVAMPAEAVPARIERELLFRIDRRGKKLKSDSIRETPPNIALIATERRRIFWANGDARIIESDDVPDKLRRAIHSLTLASGYAFARSWETTWISDPSIPYEGFGARSMYQNLTEQRHVPPYYPASARQHVPVDPLIAAEMYSKIQTAPQAFLESVNIAIERLSRSRLHFFSDEETMLDLGIACEIMLLHGKNETELAYRLALRGGYLHGLDTDERISFSRGFRDLYKARSQVAHGGKIERKLRLRITEFDGLCASTIRAIIRKGRFPDWDRLISGDQQA